MRGNPRDAQGPGISDDLQQHAPLRPGASPSGRARTQFTLRDYLPEACAPGPPQRIQSAAPLDPVAWRATILADTSRPPPPLQRLSPKVQRPPCSQPSRLQPRTQPFRPGTADACVRLSVEPQQQPALPQQRASPPLTAPIPCRNFFGPLEAIPEDERQVWQRQQTPAHGSQAPSRPGRRRRQKRAAAKGPIDRPASTVEDTAQQASRQPSAYRPGVLSDRPEFLDQLSSATGCTWSPPPPGQGGGWLVYAAATKPERGLGPARTR